MITHYALNWSERNVFWGRQKVSGALLGRERTPLGRRGAPTKVERNNATDYRNYIGLYCLYGEGDLIYIGEAGIETNSTLFSRLKQHRTGPLAGRWDQFSWFGRADCVGNCSVSASLRQLEAAAIAIINPGFNRQSGTFAGATQVYQIAHENAEGDVETKLNRMYDLLKTRK